jgi:hypothetical protein
MTSEKKKQGKKIETELSHASHLMEGLSGVVRR